MKYALIDLQGLRQGTTVSQQDVQRYYEDNKQQYATPEQVRASHILLKTEGKDDAAVKKQAEDLLAKVKGGADFAALATKFSEDEVSAAKGGDLGFFAKGTMVKEFDDVAFKLTPGETSDLVKTQFGYHIIRGTGKEAGGAADARRRARADRGHPQVGARAKRSRSDCLGARRQADQAGGPGHRGQGPRADRRRVRILRPRRADCRPRYGAGDHHRAFELKTGEVSEAIRSQNGYAFVTVTGTQESRVPTLDEVKARVREDVQKTKAVEAAKQRAAALAAQLKSAGDFSAAAKTAGLEAKTTDLLARGQALPDVGVSAAVDAAAFALPVGGVSDPITTDTGSVIVKVLEKKSPTPEELKSGKDTVRASS